VSEAAQTFTCPVCGRASHHPEDVRQRWCNACHGATGYEPPPGFRWFLFRGGSLDRTGRMMELRLLPEVYEIPHEGESYVYTDGEFVLNTYEDDDG
jgi:hypothetical protein